MALLGAFTDLLFPGDRQETLWTYFPQVYILLVPSAQIPSDGDDSEGLASVSDKMDRGQGSARKLWSDPVCEMEG